MPVRFDSPALLLASLGVTLLTGIVVAWRRPRMAAWSKALALIGLLLWSFAIAGTNWRRGVRQEIVVMVDCSPSTRTAAYRQRAALDARLRELLGDVPHRTLLFADGNQPDAGNSPTFSDIAAERTTFSPPPAAAAVVLFSDARFDLPAGSPPTYPVIDPNLEAPVDASVKRLVIRGGELVADLTVRGAARRLTLHGAAATQPIRIEPGSFSIARPLTSGASRYGAEFEPGDAWPDDDSLWIQPAPPERRERWWVGGGPPAGWRAFAADSLPSTAADYLAPAVIALNNVPADALSPAVQQRLGEYVRQLGGGLVIIGGDHAFAAGGYEGTALESLSPLASVPPEPSTRWVVLVDGSGSMAAATPAGSSQWDVAGRAVSELLRRLPPDDPASVGSFAEQVTWWANGKPVRELAAMALPPANVSPRGPTNLQRALEDVTRAGDGTMPTELIIVTDAEATLERVDDLAAQMKSRRVHLRALTIGNGTGIPALRNLADATGGSLLPAPNAATWAAGLRDLARAGLSRWLETPPLAVTFLPPLQLPNRAASPWNRTWIKSAAEPLAKAEWNGQDLRPAARWQAGNGRAIAAAFQATAAEAEAMAALVEAPPHDPRFSVTWDAGPKLNVTVDAVESGKYLNNEAMTLELLHEGEPPVARPIPQVAPGRYETSVDAPRTSCIALVRQGGRVLSQTAVAGRYAPEFGAIGNDHAAMHELARRTGGEVIDVRQTKPIAFHWPRRDVPLMPWLAAAGGVAFALALFFWRVARR